MARASCRRTAAALCLAITFIIQYTSQHATLTHLSKVASTDSHEMKPSRSVFKALLGIGGLACGIKAFRSQAEGFTELPNDAVGVRPDTCERPRSYFIPYESVSAAVTGNNNISLSNRAHLLSGLWKYVPKPGRDSSSNNQSLDVSHNPSQIAQIPSIPWRHSMAHKNRYGWYWRNFTLDKIWREGLTPEPWIDKTGKERKSAPDEVLVNLDGVAGGVEIWVDNKFAGSCRHAQYGAEFRISHLLVKNPVKYHRLAIRTFDNGKPYSSGEITGEVYLTYRPSLYFRHINITSGVSEIDERVGEDYQGHLSIIAETYFPGIFPECKRLKNFAVNFAVIDEREDDGHGELLVCTEMSQPVEEIRKGEEIKSSHVSLVIPLRKYSPEVPYVHTALITLVNEFHQILEAVAIKVGFSQVDVMEENLELNFKPLHLFGGLLPDPFTWCNRLRSSPDLLTHQKGIPETLRDVLRSLESFGDSLESLWEREAVMRLAIVSLRAMGCNCAVVRADRCPNTFLNLCSDMGLHVISTLDGDPLVYRKAALRDMNHPSLLLYSPSTLPSSPLPHPTITPEDSREGDLRWISRVSKPLGGQVSVISELNTSGLHEFRKNYGKNKIAGGIMGIGWEKEVGGVIALRATFARPKIEFVDLRNGRVTLRVAPHLNPISKIHNRNWHKRLDILNLKYSLLENAKPLRLSFRPDPIRLATLRIRPNSSREVRLQALPALLYPSPGAYYHLRVSLRSFRESPSLPEGHEEVLTDIPIVVPRVPSIGSGRTVHVERSNDMGTLWISIHDKEEDVEPTPPVLLGISRGTGLIDSLYIRGKEMLSSRLRPDFGTSEDMLALDDDEEDPIHPDEREPVLKFEYHFERRDGENRRLRVSAIGSPILEDNLYQNMTYVITANGMIHYTTSSIPDSHSAFSHVARVGTAMRLAKDFRQVRWMGFGPNSTYHGASGQTVGIWKRDLPNEPQQSDLNQVGCSYVEFTEKTSSFNPRGIRVEADNSQISFRAMKKGWVGLDYIQEQVEYKRLEDLKWGMRIQILGMEEEEEES